MNTKTLINIFAIILIPISLLLIFISSIMILLKNDSAFIITIISLVFIINSILLFIKKNYKTFVIVFLFAVIVILYNNRDLNFKEVNNYIIVDLYYPFADIRNANSKIVKLTNESSLIITNNFPRLDGEIQLFPLYSAFADAAYKITVTNNKYTNMFLYQVPFEQYTVTNDNGIVETDIVKATNSSYDTAYVLCSTIYYNTYESMLYDNAYENLINDKVDIVFANLPSNEEIEKAKSNDVEFILTPIGKEAFVFFVNSQNKVDNLSKENIKDIYTGKTRNWREVGGNSMRIKAHQMNNIGTIQSTFTNFIALMNAEKT